MNACPQQLWGLQLRRKRPDQTASTDSDTSCFGTATSFVSSMSGQALMAHQTCALNAVAAPRRSSASRRPFIVACGQFSLLCFWAARARINTDHDHTSFCHAGPAKQHRQGALHKAQESSAMKFIGSLAAAAVLVAPQTALAAARLPPIDSGKSSCVTFPYLIMPQPFEPVCLQTPTGVRGRL